MAVASSGPYAKASIPEQPGYAGTIMVKPVNTSSVNVYRPRALPDAQPTVSKN